MQMKLFDCHLKESTKIYRIWGNVPYPLKFLCTAAAILADFYSLHDQNKSGPKVDLSSFV